MASGGTGGYPPDAVIQLTKCVTIQNCESEKPPERWVNCFSMTSSTQHALWNPRDWEPASTSHVLLNINIPNQQLYHLPLLITPVRCVYLITFDLKDQMKSLAKIHSMMKTVYTLSSCAARDTCRVCPMVLLVGMHADEVKEEDRSCFARKLNEVLKRMPYKNLVDLPNDDEPFWAVDGGELSLIDVDSLSHQIQECRSEHGAEVHRWIMYHHELQEELRDAPCISYCDLKDKVGSLPSGAESLKFNEILQFLHNYGFIFYHSAERKEDERVILLQPQFVYKLFAEVLKLRKIKKREYPTIDQLWSGIGASIKPSPLDKKWFQHMCIEMGLVFEVKKAAYPEFVFLMGLEAGPNSPPCEDYSVPPLLLTFKEGGIMDVDKGLLPSHFFAAFVTEFLRTLTECNRQDVKPKRQGNLLVIESMEQHYVRVRIARTCIHVVERDFCIEIGLQQLNASSHSTTNKQKQGLQSFCKRVYKAATDSADKILRRWKLATPILSFGFYHSHETEDGPVDAFGEYVWDENEGAPILQCSCCKPGVHDTTPLHEIWCEEEFDFSKVSIQVVKTTNGPEIRQLHETPNDGVQHQPTPPPPQVAQPTPPTPPVNAAVVLEELRDQFIGDVEADVVVYELQNKGIIPQSVQTRIATKDSRRERNQILHQHLVETSTKESLIMTCGIIIAEAENGYPIMKVLGEDMKMMLEPGWTAQPFNPRLTEKSAVGCPPHIVGQHQGLPPLGQTPFPTSQPMNSYGQMSPGPSGVGYHPHIMGQHQGMADYPNMMQPSLMTMPWQWTQVPSGTYLRPSSDAPGPSGINALAPPPAPPTGLASYLQVLKENAQMFLREMNSKAIASSLLAMGLVSPEVEHDIKHSMTREDANACLFKFLHKEATEEQVLSVFEIASKDTGHGRMKEFADRILQTLRYLRPSLPAPHNDPTEPVPTTHPPPDLPTPLDDSPGPLPMPHPSPDLPAPHNEPTGPLPMPHPPQELPAHLDDPTGPHPVPRPSPERPGRHRRRRCTLL